MTETMIERVARAIAPGVWKDFDAWCRRKRFSAAEVAERNRASIAIQSSLARARAALKAMKVEDLRLELAKRRFNEQYTIDDDGCFVWTGAIDRRDGYGRFYDGSGKTQTAYGFAWRYYCGEVPTGMVLDHICRNRACVNHTHLRLVTNAENVLIGVGVTAKNARKTQCRHGHSLTDEANVYVRPDGGRGCRTCLREADKRAKAKRRAALSEDTR
jgi:hypothetical protein